MHPVFHRLKTSLVHVSCSLSPLHVLMQSLHASTTKKFCSSSLVKAINQLYSQYATSIHKLQNHWFKTSSKLAALIPRFWSCVRHLKLNALLQRFRDYNSFSRVLTAWLPIYDYFHGVVTPSCTFNRIFILWGLTPSHPVMQSVKETCLKNCPDDAKRFKIRQCTYLSALPWDDEIIKWHSVKGHF